jgi:hypothetical protein
MTPQCDGRFIDFVPADGTRLPIGDTEKFGTFSLYGLGQAQPLASGKIYHV